MFKRSFRSREGENLTSQREVGSTSVDSRHRVDKAARLMKRGMGSMRHPAKISKLRSFYGSDTSRTQEQQQQQQQMRFSAAGNISPSPIVTLAVSHEARLFAAHEDVLCQAPFFEKILRSGVLGSSNRRIALPEEEAEVFSVILEYLYKGDYYPRLVHNRPRGSYTLEDAHLQHRRATPQASPTMHECRTGAGVAGGTTVFLASLGQHVLRDTVVYCAADRYGLEQLKRLALRKQGLHSGIDVGTILRSAQYCYAHTPDSDSRLRAHYLALIIRCRATFKRSGTMQAEMEKCGDGNGDGDGSGRLFFDLFVALCNHLDDVIEASSARTPKTI